MADGEQNMDGHQLFSPAEATTEIEAQNVESLPIQESFGDQMPVGFAPAETEEVIPGATPDSVSPTTPEVQQQASKPVLTEDERKSALVRQLARDLTLSNDPNKPVLTDAQLQAKPLDELQSLMDALYGEDDAAQGEGLNAIIDQERQEPTVDMESKYADASQWAEIQRWKSPLSYRIDDEVPVFDEKGEVKGSKEAVEYTGGLVAQAIRSKLQSAIESDMLEKMVGSKYGFFLTEMRATAPAPSGGETSYLNWTTVEEKILEKKRETIAAQGGIVDEDQIKAEAKQEIKEVKNAVFQKVVEETNKKYEEFLKSDIKIEEGQDPTEAYVKHLEQFLGEFTKYSFEEDPEGLKESFAERAKGFLKSKAVLALLTGEELLSKAGEGTNFGQFFDFMLTGREGYTGKNIDRSKEKKEPITRADFEEHLKNQTGDVLTRLKLLYSSDKNFKEAFPKTDITVTDTEKNIDEKVNIIDFINTSNTQLTGERAQERTDKQKKTGLKTVFSHLLTEINRDSKAGDYAEELGAALVPDQVLSRDDSIALFKDMNNARLQDQAAYNKYFDLQ